MVCINLFKGSLTGFFFSVSYIGVTQHINIVPRIRSMLTYNGSVYFTILKTYNASEVIANLN